MGKTRVLIMEPMAQIAVEHERCSDPTHPFPLKWGKSTGWALHLRRTIKQLEQTIIISKRLFPEIDPGAKFDEQKTTWTFSSGYHYQFGHCQNPSDHMNYLSYEFTIICFDELVQFLEEQYENICTRLRSTDPVLKHMLKIRSMSNPVSQRAQGENYSIDPMWVRARFVDFNPRGSEVQVFQTTRPDGTVVEKTRMFLAGLLTDNPDPEFQLSYERQLLFAKSHIRAAMLHGNWYITEGSFFGDEWNDAIHVIKPFRIPQDWKRFRAMDWGFKKPGVIGWFAMDPDENLICEREMRFQGMTVKAVAKRVQEIEEAAGLWKGKRSLISGPADTQLWEKRGEEGLSKAEEFAKAGIAWLPADKKSRARNAERISERLKDHDSGGALPGLAFFDNCKNCIKYIPCIQTDAKDPDCPQDGGEDHELDMIGYACAFASRGLAGIQSFDTGSGEDDWDEDEEDPESQQSSRGRWGYGGL